MRSFACLVSAYHHARCQTDCQHQLHFREPLSIRCCGTNNRRSFFLEMPWLNGVCFQIFIDELAKTFPETLNILVLDNGSFHYAKSLKLPDNIALIFLPPYSPELNPIERLWQDIKAKLFQHTLGTIEEMQDKITQILRNYTKAAIAQITSFKYFTKVANGI